MCDGIALTSSDGNHGDDGGDDRKSHAVEDGETGDGVDASIVLHTGERQGGGHVGPYCNDLRVDEGLGHMLLAVGGLLGGGAHGVVAEVREERRRGSGHHWAEAARHGGVVVLGVDVEDA